MDHCPALTPAADTDQALGLEDSECLSYRRLADVELRQQVLLLGERVGTAVLAAQDTFTNGVGDQLRDQRLAELGSGRTSLRVDAPGRVGTGVVRCCHGRGLLRDGGSDLGNVSHEGPPIVAIF